VLVFALNGKVTSIPAGDVDPTLTLNAYLRDVARLTGTKLSCGEGGCGACAVTLSRWDSDQKKEIFRSVNSCLAPLVSCHGWSITTTEGLRRRDLKSKKDPASEASLKEKSDGRDFHPIHTRIANNSGMQCGFCTPGMVMTMYQALKKQPEMTMEEIEGQFDGNICRCTGYRPILDTAKTFAVDSNVKDHICLRSYSKGSYDQKKWDPVFPEELKDFKVGRSRLEFVGGGIKWIKPEDSLSSVLEMISSNSSSNPVGGRTSLGIYKPLPATHSSEIKGQKDKSPHLYKDDAKLRVHIDLSDVGVLSRIEEASVEGIKGIEIGGSAKIAAVMEALKSSKSKSSSFEHLLVHMKKVANVHVRDSGSFAGNIILAKTKGFLSDLATLLLGTNAIVSWACKNVPKTSAYKHAGSFRGKSGIHRVIQSMQDFLSSPQTPDGAVLGSILIPYLQKGSLFRSYRVAIRPQNSHAIVNAAFSAELSEHKVIKVTLAMGGLMNHEKIGAHALRLHAIEKLLTGKGLTNETFGSVRDAVSKLASSIVSKEGGMREETRIRLAESFLMKFLLTLTEKNVHHELRKGGVETIDSLRKSVSKGYQEFSYPDTHAPIAVPTPLPSGKFLASGSAKFTSDLKPLPGTLHAALVIARRARATIKNIDWSGALKMPGVHGYVSKEDLGESNCSTWGEPFAFYDKEKFPLYYTSNYVIGIGDEVPFHGKPLGIVLADSPARARAAALRVLTTYDESTLKEPVVDVKSSKELEQVCPSCALPTVSTQKKGTDVKEVLQSSEVTEIRGKVHTGSQRHFYMENQVAYVIPDEEMGYKIYCATQFPSAANSLIAKLLGLPQSMIQIIHNRMGGSFGGKYDCTFVGMAAVGAKKYDRPVKFYLDKNNDMRNISGRVSYNAEFKVGVDKEGRIKGLDFEATGSAGARPNFAWFTNLSLATALSGGYAIFNQDFRAYLTFTNLPGGQVVRGPGEIQAGICMETIIERIAYELGKDSHDIRTLNLISEDKKILETLGFNGKYDNCTLQRMWKTLEERAEYKSRAAAVQKFNSENKLRKRGICMVPLRYSVNMWKKSALVNLYTDGTVLVRTGGSEMGQGLNVKVQQIVSYELGRLLGESIPIEDIKMAPMDSNVLSCQIFTGGSTGSEASAEAARRACQTLVNRMRPVLQGMEAKVKKDVTGDSSQPAINFAAVCAAAEGANLQMQALGHWADSGDDKASYQTWGCGCSEVEIDVLTGEMVLLRSDLYYDAAQSLNPSIDIGQAEGAFMMGIGMLLQEETLIDSSNGELISHGTWEYKPPLAVNVPKEWNVIFFQGNKSGKVLSSKASGEPPLVMSTSVLMALRHAIADARKDAGNVDWFDMPTPVTVEQRLKLLQPAWKQKGLKEPLAS